MRIFFYLGSHYFFDRHLHRNPLGLGYYQQKPRFRKYGYDFASNPKSEWSLPWNECQVMVLILLGQTNSWMDVTVWLLHGIPRKCDPYFSGMVTFMEFGPLSQTPREKISLVAVWNGNCVLSLKGIWGSHIKTLRILVEYFPQNLLSLCLSIHKIL